MVLSRYVTGIKVESGGVRTCPFSSISPLGKLWFNTLLKDPAIVLKELTEIPIFQGVHRRSGPDRPEGGRSCPETLAAEVGHRGRSACVDFSARHARRARRVCKVPAGRVRALPVSWCSRCPVALNSGLLAEERWKRPGTITVHILPPIAPGLGERVYDGA